MVEQVQVEKSLWSELLNLLKRLGDGDRVVVEEEYWYHNAVHIRKKFKQYKKRYVYIEVVSRDGLVLEIYWPEDNPSELHAYVESLHQSLCSCGD